MAERQSTRNSGDLPDSIKDWMAKRKAEVQRDGDKFVASGRGFVARRVGNGVGIARGLLHMGEAIAQDSLESAALAGRVLNPMDRVLHPPGQSVVDQMTSTASDASNHIVHGLLHPASFARHIKDKAHRLQVDLDPNASPPLADPKQEQDRNFKIGENQGELGLEGAALLFGGAGLKVLGRLAPISEAAGAAKFKALKFSDAQAARLARPYSGKGHHMIPQRAKLPKTLGGIALPSFIAGKGLPSAFMDSRFNVLKPKNISQGNFYELHSQVDPHFRGAKIGAKDGGGSWSQKQSKVKKYGLLGSLWHGSPAPLNAAVGALGAAGLSKFKHSNRR